MNFPMTGRPIGMTGPTVTPYAPQAPQNQLLAQALMAMRSQPQPQNQGAPNANSIASVLNPFGQQSGAGQGIGQPGLFQLGQAAQAGQGASPMAPGLSTGANMGATP